MVEKALHWDYFLFAAMLIFIHWRQERARRSLLRQAVREAGGEPPAGVWANLMPAGAAIVLAGLLAGGWIFTDYREHRTRLALQEASQGAGLFMAGELERMGHAAIPGSAAADDAKKLAIASIMAGWLSLEPRVDNLCTLRRLPDGTTVYVLVPADSVLPVQARSGQIFTATVPELEQAFQDKPAFQTHPSQDHPSIRQFVPLHDAAGRVEAVLSVGFNASRWERIIRQERIAAMGLLFILAFVLNTLYGAVHRRRFEAVCERHRSEQLQESEARFRNFADHAPVLLQVTDNAGNANFFNQTWLEFTGQTPSAQSGRDWLRLVHPEDRPALVAGQTEALARREIFRHEFRLKRSCGSYRWMVAVYMPRWQGDSFAGYIISCTDITARRRLEQTLRHQVEFEKLLAAVAAKFVNLSPGGLSAAIETTLEETARFTGADRACIYLFSGDLTEARHAYSWNAAGVPDLSREARVLAVAADSWLTAELTAKGRIRIPQVAAMPANAEREELAAAGIKSLVSVPLALGGRLYGFFALHALREEKEWREEDISLPKVVGEIILGAIQRCQAETALAKSEAENKAIIASVPDILYRVDADGIILDSKPSGQPGVPLPVGSSITSLLPAHFAKQALDAIARALASREVQVLEYYTKTESATTYFEARVTRAGERDALVIIRDITERRRSEACDLLLLDIAIKVLEEHPLEDILSFACQHIKAIFDVPILWVGRKEENGAVRMFAAGGEIAELLRNGEISWHDNPAGRGPTGTAIRTGKFQQVTIDDPCMQTWRESLVSSGVVSGAAFPLKVGGLILGALTVYTAQRDFWTKRTVVHLTNFAEQVALAIHSTTSRQRLKLLTTGLESTANAVVITDRTGAIQWVNPSFLRLTGLGAPAVLSKNIRSIFGVAGGRRFYRNLWQHILSGRAWQGEITSRRTDGSVYTAEMTVTPVRDENREIANFIAIVQDVTHRRQAEQDMHEAREAVARAERLSSLGIMAAGIAHEINQPLNSLKVAADGMLYWHRQGKTPTLAKIMENIEKISKQADRIDNIIKHMRFFVHSNQGGQPEPCDINAAVGEALSLIGAQLAAHRVAVRTRLSAGLPPILANVTQLEEVIINLLVNAMQSLDTVDMPDKCITVVSGWQQGEIFLEISDNGPGISNKIKGKIFEPFFTTKPAGEGMGLGLSIVHSIVTSYGGRITTKPVRQGQGAIFRIVFPLCGEKEKGEKQA